MNAKLIELETQAKSNPETKAVYESFVADKALAASFARQDGESISVWERQSSKHRRNDQAEISRRGTAGMTEKLAALGHDMRGIRNASWNSPFSRPTELSDQNWAKISSKAIGLVETEKTRRLEQEAWTRRFERQRLVEPYCQWLLNI